MEEQQTTIHDLISDRPYQRLSPSRRNIQNGILLQRLVNMGNNPAIADIQTQVRQLPINPMRSAAIQRYIISIIYCCFVISNYYI